MREACGRGRLLSALRDPDSLAQLDGAHWSDVLDHGRGSGLLARLESLLAARMLLDRIPEKARLQLLEARSFVRRNQTDIRFEVDRITRALAHLDMPIVLLKGAAYLFAALPPAGRHAAADLDILVPKEHLATVERALRAAGWQTADLSEYDARYYREWMHQIPPLWHPDRLFAVDIHHTILPTTSRYEPDAGALLAAAVPLDDRSLKVLCPADMVLHAAAHLFTEEFISGLRQLAVVHDLLEHFGKSDQFWIELLERSRRHGLERILYYALRYGRRVLRTEIPHEVARATAAHRPNPVVLAIMDAAVMSALRPTAFGESSPGRGIALWVLYLRSHWLKMPPLLLLRHVLSKAVQRFRIRFRLASARTAVDTN